MLEREKGLAGWGAERVGENQFIVEPVFDTAGEDDDPGFVEDVRGGVHRSRGRVDGIERGGLFGGRCLRVVKELVLGTAGAGLIAGFAGTLPAVSLFDAVLDARVATRG